MIRRTFDPQIINEIVNHPKVRPWVGCDEIGGREGYLDLTASVLNQNNFALHIEGGAFLCVGQGDGVYEVHTMFVPEARVHALKAARDGQEYMFLRTDCRRLTTKVPDDNKGALRLTLATQFRELFRREKCWNGEGIAHFAVDIEDWASSNKDFATDGEWLHSKFEESREAAGAIWKDHPEDQAHDIAAGAAVRMVKAGNTRKGVNFYNAWANLAGYPQIGIVQDQPVVLDLSAGEAKLIMEYRDGDLETLLCQ